MADFYKRIFPFICALGLLITLSQMGCKRGGDGAGTSQISLASELNKLCDVQQFSTKPLGMAKLASSADPTGANRDWAQPSRIAEDGSLTILEAEGPGCIRRIWMTAQSPLKWMIYFDGETSPRIEGVYEPKEDVAADHPNQVFKKPLFGSASGGYYSYVPIPYEKSIRIVAVEGFQSSVKRPYYQVNYETFPEGTNVESFPRRLSGAMLEQVGKAAEAYSQISKVVPEAVDASSAGSALLEAKPGQASIWLEEAGAKILTGFSVQIDPDEKLSASERALCLRNLVLEIRWDGNESASVSAPLGDFFCNPFYFRSFNSLPMESNAGVLKSRFEMAFLKSATGIIKNNGPVPVELKVEITLAENPSAEPYYFHANFRQLDSVNAPAGKPLTVLKAKGRGHLAGTYLYALGTDGRSWAILEGDEIKYIDNDLKPSLHGTGLEDYFNGAWYYKGLSHLPHSGLLEKSGMRTSQYHFHGMDAIGFNERISYDFEFGHELGATGPPNQVQGYMSTVAYWYQDTPTAAGELPSVEQLRPVDPFQVQRTMSGIFELEAIGHYKEAMERCEIMSQMIGSHPWAKLFAERSKMYAPLLKGNDQVSIADKAPIVFCQTPHRGTVYWNGNPIAKTETGSRLYQVEVSKMNATSIIAVQVDRARSEDWLLGGIYLDGEVQNSAETWEISAKKPSDWPQCILNDNWQPCINPKMSLPTMGHWQFEPNTLVGAQSGFIQVRPFANSPETSQASVVYLRRKVEVE